MLALLAALLPAPVLALLEGAVAQFLLLLDHVAELIELRHHVAEVVAVHIRRRHLQVLHHLLELLQKLTGRILGAVARQVLQPVEHVLEILRAHRAGVAVERPGKLLIVLLLLAHRLHVAIHRGAQLVHELLEVLLAGAALERLAQRLLGVAQRRLRVGNVAVLEADRHRPQPPDDVAQIVVGLGANQRPEDRAQPEIDAGVGRELLRRHRQRVERGDDERSRIGVEREIAPLLDQRLRQRLGEDALGQAQRERLALALVAALVAGDERHHHFGAGPGMIGQILDGLADAVAGARLRQDQREIGRAEQRTPALALCRRLVLAHKGRLRLGHPVIVFDAVGQKERAAPLLFGIFGERDGRRLVGDDVERPGQVVADAAQRRGAGSRRS